MNYAVRRIYEIFIEYGSPLYMECVGDNKFRITTDHSYYKYHLYDKNSDWRSPVITIVG